MISFRAPRYGDPRFDVHSNEKIDNNMAYTAVKAFTDQPGGMMRQGQIHISSRPLSIPSRNTSRSSSPATMKTTATRSRESTPRRTSNGRNTHVIPPSTAALLAMTTIPSRRNARKKSANTTTTTRRISIDQLVQEWKIEAQSMPSNASHRGSLDFLLEPSEIDCAESLSTSVDDYSLSRLSSKSSSESMPSLDMDDGSLLSIGNPPTPEAVRASRPGSINTIRKSKQRPSVSTQECIDHPLLQRPTAPARSQDEVSDMSFTIRQKKTPSRRKSSLKSNITSSLQSLKTRALTSISQFSLSTVGPNPHYNPYAFSDATLWQHPAIFPRVGPEIRPEAFADTPTESQRRYFNPPTPLSFEEQESRYRKALHTSQPDLDRQKAMVQMRTFSRPPARRQQPARAKTAPQPDTEAGRAMALAALPPSVRPREPRENSDFLRVVVLEMNMRRVGKLEDTVAGRARIWLPPRQGHTPQPEQRAPRIPPRRWRSVGAEAE